jgi:hypothetical protein
MLLWLRFLGRIEMERSFVKEWIGLIRPLFPPDTRIVFEEGNDVVLRIDWKLGNDPERSNKRSHLIRVVISEEAIEDCKEFNIAGIKFKKVIEERLSSFNPEHDKPKYAGSPAEEWTISTFDIN